MSFIHHLMSLLLVSKIRIYAFFQNQYFYVTAVSLDNDVNTNKELVAHGYSNFIAGLVGTV
jgi:MFS superfamily sulfate permease-like transporter